MMLDQLQNLVGASQLKLAGTVGKLIAFVIHQPMLEVVIT
jgi:hypothetical protein